MKEALFSQTLRRSLADWTYPDIAAYYVAVALGVAPYPGEDWDFWGRAEMAILDGESDV